MQEVHTLPLSGVNALGLPAERSVKTLLVKGEADENGESGLVALILRGDHTLNEIKAENLAGIAELLTMATDGEIVSATCSGSIGLLTCRCRSLSIAAPPTWRTSYVVPTRMTITRPA